MEQFLSIKGLGLDIMTNRELFRNFVKGSSKQKVLPFPMCKTAFIASSLGREWATDVTYEECRDVMLSCGCIPSVVIGEKEWFPDDHYLSLSIKPLNKERDKIVYRSSVETPYGEMAILLAECKRQSLTITKGPVENEGDFNKVIWYMKEVRNNTEAIKDKIKDIRTRVGDECLITLFLPQPYELYTIFNREESIYFEYDYPEKFYELANEVFLTVSSIVKPAVEAGADLLFFGAAGTELYSPELFKKHIYRPSVEYARLVREAGGISSFHLCGKAKQYIDMEVFNDIEVDIVEGLAMEPVGDLKSLKGVRQKLPESVVIRGNIDLEVLLKSSSECVYKEVKLILNEINGYKHLVSGACDILYGTPADNIHMLSKICNEYNNKG